MTDDADRPTKGGVAVRRRPGHGGAVGAAAGGGFLASLPIVGPAFASACASCLGIGGVAASGAAVGWGTPIGIAIAIGIMAFSVWRTLRVKRLACSAEDYRRARLLVPVLTLAVGVAGYAFGAFLLAPLFEPAGQGAARPSSGLLP